MSSPMSFAASITSMPFGASTSRPSIVSFTVSEGADAVTNSPLVERAALFGDVPLVFVVVLLDRGDNGAGGEVAEGAQHLAADLAGERQQQVEVARHAAASLDPRQHFEQPGRAFATRRALAARLMAEELFHERRRSHDARVLIEHDQG